MIWLFNPARKVAASYKSFEEVCDHFRRLEHLKPTPEETPYDAERWDFIYWTHKRLSVLHEHFKDTPFSEAEREAYENELDLIEIFAGSPEVADQYIVTPDLDVTSLMREWCFGYAHSHGYTVLETFSNNLGDDPCSVIHPTFSGVGSGCLQEPFREGGQP